jgi:hypothetical protein
MRWKPVAACVVVLAVVLWAALRSPKSKPETHGSQVSAASALPAPGRAPARFKAGGSGGFPPMEQPGTNFFQALAEGHWPQLTAAQVAGYLAANHRNAGSLLAAYHTTSDRAFLEEAMAKYPNDPRVAYTAWFRGGPYANEAEESQARRHWLDVLEQAAPDNSMANYLSAQNYFKSGQTELAVQEMQAGGGKASFNDYTQEAIQDVQEAYVAAGLPESEAKAASTMGALLPDLAELKSDAQSLAGLADTCRQSGDTASAQAALQMCMDLGRRLDSPDSMTLIQQLVGIAIQRIALHAMDPTTAVGDSGQTVQETDNALAQERQGIRTLTNNQLEQSWLQSASDADICAYFDRMRIFGEQNALRWLAVRAAPQ